MMVMVVMVVMMVVMVNYKAILISEETTVEDVIRLVSWMLVLLMSMTTMMTMMTIGHPHL